MSVQQVSAPVCQHAAGYPTRRGQKAHRMAGEPVCDTCAAEARQYVQNWKRGRLMSEAERRASSAAAIRKRFKSSEGQQPAGAPPRRVTPTEVECEDALGFASRRGAQRHRRRGEPVCKECAAETAAYQYNYSHGYRLTAEQRVKSLRAKPVVQKDKLIGERKVSARLRFHSQPEEAQRRHYYCSGFGCLAEVARQGNRCAKCAADTRSADSLCAALLVDFGGVLYRCGNRTEDGSRCSDHRDWQSSYPPHVTGEYVDVYAPQSESGFFPDWLTRSDCEHWQPASYAGWKRHKRAGETPCEDCVAACYHAQQVRERKKSSQ